MNKEERKGRLNITWLRKRRRRPESSRVYGCLDNRIIGNPVKEAYVLLARFP
jgi:hypothetical protein